MGLSIFPLFRGVFGEIYPGEKEEERISRVKKQVDELGYQLLTLKTIPDLHSYFKLLTFHTYA